MQKFTTIICGILVGVLMVFTPISKAETLPDKIAIESLKNLYEPVIFGHAEHIVREKDCAVCHHHTNGAPASDASCIRCHRGGHEVKSMGCRNCHDKDPFSAELIKQKFVDNQIFHQDKPGLKAAYHLSCLGCHKKKGGPVGCVDCHGLTSDGNAFYRSGEYAPDPKKALKVGH